MEELAADDECVAGRGADTEQCSLHALQRNSLRAAPETISPSSGRKCGDLSAPENAKCKTAVLSLSVNRTVKPGVFFRDIRDVTNMTLAEGSVDDIQRMYYCAAPNGINCGLPPCACSSPPCDTCFGGKAPSIIRPACARDPTSIACVPPKMPMQYKGRAWTTLTFRGTQEMHVYALGDWGGMDGSLTPIEGRPRMITYAGGQKAGPSVFPRNRWDRPHKNEICSQKDLSVCLSSNGGPRCSPLCGFVPGIDNQPQMLVAESMKQRALKHPPQFIINVGDNFYWGGIDKTCGTPMHLLSPTAAHQFDQIFEGVYNSEGLKGAPWLSVLGNHDWGGRVFSNGWDQQIAYTWHSDRWIMPAPYWSQRVEFPDQNFSIDLYMLDTNFIDAQEPKEDPEHNICGSAHNPPGVGCGPIGGPESVPTCVQYFKDLWVEQVKWVEAELPKSTATWQMISTHFPCGHETEFYRRLYKQYGLDLLVTGHRHDQELWFSNPKNALGGLTCIVTGGGGGITSEASPDPSKKAQYWGGEAQYGFFDLIINQTAIVVQSLNYDGRLLLETVVHPH